MRIGAYFAVFAILNYTKIIDNSWYSSYLFNHFRLGIQWIKETTDEVITLPIAFSKIKFVVLGTCAAREWIYENVSVLDDSDLSTVTAWSASENQVGKIVKMKNIIAMGI